MDSIQTPIVKRSLLSWIFSGNRKLKLLLILTVFIAVLIRIIPLEMQKRIVNQAISMKAFDMLLIYCGFYLLAVVTAGALKYLISYFQTIIGQRTLTAMRQELYRHMLSLPLFFFRKTQPGMVVQSFASELATAGDRESRSAAIYLPASVRSLSFCWAVTCRSKVRSSWVPWRPFCPPRKNFSIPGKNSSICIRPIRKHRPAL